MKNLRTAVLCTCMILYSIYALAQDHKIPVNEPDYSKPHLFDNLPAKIPFNTETFSGLLNKQAGSTVRISLSADASVAFEGKLVSSDSRENGNVQSILVRSTNFPGATFSMSKIITDDGDIIYNGRMLSFRHSDIYILQKTNGQYELIRKNFYDLVNE